MGVALCSLSTAAAGLLTAGLAFGHFIEKFDFELIRV
jgi:hypothetical protein